MTGQNNQAIYLDGRKPLEPKNWRKFLSAAVGVVAVLVCQIARADTTSEVRALFEQFITAQNRRDMEALKNVLVDGPNFVW